MLKNIYQNYLLKYPRLVLGVLVVLMVFMVAFAMRLEIDASAETLLLEGDKDLEFARVVAKRFESQNMLVVTYSVKDELLNQKNIDNIKELSKKLEKISIVESVNSIVNVPLLQSPVRPLKELLKDIPNLESEGLDKSLAKKEFLNSPIYEKNLVSPDFQTTALALNLKRDDKYFELINKRDSFVKLKKQKALSKSEKKEFEKVSKELKEYRDKQRVINHQAIVDIRKILSDFSKQHPEIKIHLGGVEMIADDMVEFVKHDLKTFGLLIVLLLVIILYILLRDISWVMIALFICSISLAITSGLLGLFGWEITVVSSNFISLQLIMNMSLVVHLIIKYKELHAEFREYSQEELVLQTVLSMAKPSFFVVITTIAGFSSLVFSNILPVINFGWMMSIGIIISLFTTFVLFPVILILLNKKKLDDSEEPASFFTHKVAEFAYSYKKSIIAATILVALFSLSGATKLRVENSFIDYFKKETEIYKGMALIDKKLGGTTPLDVIITFKEASDEVESVEIISDEDDEMDSFEDEFEESADDKQKYWFTESKMQRIKQVHNYLDSLEAVGKVLSLATMGEVIKILNDGEEADSLTLALLYKELPDEYRSIILSPYINIETNQVRISTRIIDSMPKLNRDLLIKKINKDVADMLNPKYEDFRVSGLLVMYDNVLQSLFDSQIKTIGIVILILFIIFLILFRSLKIAIIAMIANTLPVSVIFGFMGWMDIPLDMMTITIAAISIGIAVDDTIHYIYRYNLEYNESHDTKQAIMNSHASIGTAMFYTSTIIMVGFSVLVLSNFLPSIYFGLLTMIAMFMAIVADLLLLPVLLLLFHSKPASD
jgi:predicted RND superfamily exporter protein